MLEKKEINQIIEKIVSELNFLLVDLLFRGNKVNPIVEVYIDNLDGITADDCKKVSSLISEKIDDKYRIDVSSPGVDRPLKFIQQYHKHIKRKLEIIYSLNDETKVITGTLIEVLEDKIVLEDKKEKLVIKFDNIVKTKVIISF